MQYSEDLYILIKSLSKAEKRHFKLQNVQTKNKQDYIILYEILDKLQFERRAPYDEDVLKKKLRGKIRVQQLHVTKNYLYYTALNYSTTQTWEVRRVKIEAVLPN